MNMLDRLQAVGERSGSAGGRAISPVLRWLIVLLGLALVFYQVWSYATRPSTLTIAVGPPSSSREAFVVALAKSLAENATPHRVKLVPVSSTDEAAAYLDDDKVKLAVVRSDEARKFDARSIAIVDRRAVFFVARANERISAGVSEELAGDVASEKPALPEVLRPDRMLGKRIVVGLDDLGSNRALVARLLAHSGLAEPAITLTESPSASVASLLAEDKADVAALVLDVAEPAARALMAGISKALSGAIAIGGPPSPEALAALYRDITVTKIAAGIFGGLHALPAQSVSTVAITDELVGDSNLSDAVAAQLTKAILERRGRMLAENGSFEIESPPLDALRRYMPHAGVAAHLNERATSFLETYSDQIWLGLFALGLIGSSLAGLWSRLGLFGGDQLDSTAARIEELVDGIESATTMDEIDRARSELRKLAQAQLKLAVNAKGASSELTLPPNWFQTLDDLALRRAQEISKS